MIRSITLFGSLAVLVLNTAAHALVYNFTDTTFSNANWIGLKHTDTSPGAVSTFASFQNTPGGSAILPGPQTPDYRLIRHVYGTGGSAIVVSHRDVLFTWTPSPLETAVTADYSYDLNYFDGPSGAVGFKPAIFQGGNMYAPVSFDQIFGPQSGWQRFGGSAIPIASFTLIDPATGVNVPGSPNPTAAMDFGFLSANSASGLSTKISGLDDYRFTLNTIVAPEPSTLAAVGLAGVLVRRRRLV